jgi:SPP1 family predicted phage head-tail adaptor
MIGLLRERVALQSPTASTDAIGDVTQAWATVAQVWARVQALAARDEQQQAREEHVARWRVTIRHRADVAAGWRLLWRGRELYVEATLPDERRAYTTLDCVEVVTS